jgi:hypothetical protein
MTESTMESAHHQLSALVGHSGPELHGRVDQRDIERFALASGDESPIYASLVAARAAGYEDMPSPPLLLSSVIEWNAGPPLHDLRVDGTGVGRESWLPLDGLRLMGGGQDLEFHMPVGARAPRVSRPCREGGAFRAGGSGSLLLIVITTRFLDSAGVPLLTCRETLIGR